MKIDLRSALWRGREGRLWRLADRIEDTATAVRYSHKPYDLVFPISNLIDLSRQLEVMKLEWLESWLELNPQDRGRWPHL